jgi:hypothetical protein
MSKRIELKYHTPVFRVLGREPVVSPEAVRAIEECEATCRTRLPAAVREWYSLEGVEQLLAEHSGACGPTSLAYLLEQFVRARARPRVQKPACITIFTAWRANTGWEADLVLTGEDDPPVDADAEPSQIPSSHYILNMAWWRQTFNDQPSAIHGHDRKADPAVCGPEQLAFLRERFEELPRDRIAWFNLPPRTLVPGQRAQTFRFIKPGWYVEVNTDGDPSTGLRPAVYCLTADTKEELQCLDEMLRPCRERPPG